MSLQLHAFVARAATLARAVEEAARESHDESTVAPLAGGRPAPTLRPLRFGLALLPVDEIARFLDEAAAGEPAFVELLHLTGGLARWAAEASRRGPIAYVEIEDEGAVCWSAATLWEAGSRRLDPRYAESRAPVDAALRGLGVQVRAGERDAIAALGLDE